MFDRAYITTMLHITTSFAFTSRSRYRGKAQNPPPPPPVGKGGRSPFALTCAGCDATRYAR